MPHADQCQLQPLLRIVSGTLVVFATAVAQDADGQSLGNSPGKSPGIGCGVDPDGRIPKISRPDDLPDPERWRYLPPARVRKGDFIERFGITSFAIPLVFSEEAIGTGVGIGLIDTDFRGQERQEVAAAFVSRTTLGQEQYALVWRRYLDNRRMNNGGVIQRETSFVNVTANHSKTLTTRFFGFGPNTEKDDETSYADAASWLDAGIQGGPCRPLPEFIVQVHLRAEHHDLAVGKVNEIPSTTMAYQGMASTADGINIGVIRSGIAWDTRDSAANPYCGYDVAIDCDTRFDGGGVPNRLATVSSTFTHSLPSVFHDGGMQDLRTRGPEENPPTDVIALGGFVKRAYGDVPFYDLPSLGGSKSLRGYLENRFVDKVAWNVSAEWRTWIMPRGFTIYDDIRVERFGLAPFCDIGRVGRDFHEAFHGPVQVNPGISLRFALERALVFRLDVARSKDQVGINFEAGMAF